MRYSAVKYIRLLLASLKSEPQKFVPDEVNGIIQLIQSTFIHQNDVVAQFLNLHCQWIQAAFFQFKNGALIDNTVHQLQAVHQEVLINVHSIWHLLHINL